MTKTALTSIPTVLAGACALALSLAPNAAEACGGTFCDTGPQSMPVDQTGENILFVMGDENIVEAHIQIQYDPDADADKFAWVIPMTAVPEFEVGSERLFQNMLAGTVPTYGYSTTQESCGGEGDDEAGGWGDEGESGTGDESTEDSGGGGPTVVLEEIVGAFEIAVLEGGTIEGVMQWLEDNGYQQDPNAEPILAEYLEEGHLFVAIKLGMNAEVDEIHPIVLRYQGDETCVPLRLTRIAAVEDMDVRVFVIGDGRAVPTNYRHVLVNPLKIDWINFASNYKEVISLAVDAFAADGNAFVTEYAGPSGQVSIVGLHSALWDAQAVADLGDDPSELIPTLEAQGLVECFDGLCTPAHDLLPPMLDAYLPVPNGLTPEEFYGCVPCFVGLVDTDAWDAAALAADLDARIIQPGLHAQSLIQDYPYISRMYTTISPNEMYEDPIFHINPTLPEVPNNRQGTRFNLCAGGSLFTLPDGREVYLPNSNQWPEFQDEMPWEEDVEQAAFMGPNQVLSDQTEVIDTLLAEWNESNGWNGEEGGGSGGNESESGGDVGIDDVTESGCSCSTEDDDPTRGALGLAALFGLGMLVRRRRR
ncbi:hypothetical protein PPSIR1_16765 [Plesiocystis pacifica SIR-1]|uniref:Uncharacterized protein n=1 Tax=Plesiocystis pacifica SIR-1 TaxID=391625 RepID=A6G3A8_9BACT|nr:DUF2330 domain-containing protein [Plesiocystis pacifica]EDM79733.1 hypothetical protein PPSIR1_16765 [Plesiocystis pacifica SIR-1]